MTSIGQYMTIIAQYMTSIGQYMTIIDQYMTIIAQYMTSIGQYMTIITQYITNIGQYMTIIAQYITNIGQYMTIIGQYASCVDGSSIGIILGEATEEELEALDEILKSTSIFKEGETTVTSIEEEGTIDKKWGDTVAKVF